MEPEPILKLPLGRCGYRNLKWALGKCVSLLVHHELLFYFLSLQLKHRGRFLSVLAFKSDQSLSKLLSQANTQLQRTWEPRYPGTFVSWKSWKRARRDLEQVGLGAKAYSN